MLQETKEFDPFAEAMNPKQRSFDLWGKVELSAWVGALVVGQGRVPFNKDDPTHSPLTMIDIYIQPLMEIDVKYPKTLEDHTIGEFLPWINITLPSIKETFKALTGHEIGTAREVNGLYAHIKRIKTGEKYDKKDRTTGQPTGEKAEKTTFKFIALFSDENACRADYIAVNGEPAPKGNGHNVPTTDPIVAPEDAERTTAYAFLKAIVTNAAKGKAAWNEAKESVALALTQYPTVAKYYTADSIETGQLITEVTKLLPY